MEKEIINAIKDIVEKQKSLIEKANVLDIKYNGTTLDFSRLITTINSFENEQFFYGLHLSKSKYYNFISEKLYSNIGSLGLLVENNDLYSSIYAILWIILCHNDVCVNFTKNRNYGTINVICELINKVYEANKLHQPIKVKTSSFVEFCKNVTEIDKMVIVGSKKFYQDISPLLYMPNVYYPFGEPNLIIMNTTFESDYTKMSKTTNVYSPLPLNYFTNVTKVETLDEAMYLIDKTETLHQTALFTFDQNDGIRFLNTCQSSYCLVNTTPSYSLPLINQYDLLSIKVLVHS